MQTWCRELCNKEKLLGKKPAEEYIDAVKNSHGLAMWGSLHSSMCFSFGHQSLLEGCQCSIHMIVYFAWGRPLGFIWELKLLHMACDSLSRSLTLQVCNKAEVMLIFWIAYWNRCGNVGCPETLEILHFGFFPPWVFVERKKKRCEGWKCHITVDIFASALLNMSYVIFIVPVNSYYSLLTPSACEHF